MSPSIQVLPTLRQVHLEFLNEKEYLLFFFFTLVNYALKYPYLTKGLKIEPPILLFSILFSLFYILPPLYIYSLLSFSHLPHNHLLTLLLLFFFFFLLILPASFSSSSLLAFNERQGAHLINCICRAYPAKRHNYALVELVGTSQQTL